MACIEILTPGGSDLAGHISLSVELRGNPLGSGRAERCAERQNCSDEKRKPNRMNEQSTRFSYA